MFSLITGFSGVYRTAALAAALLWLAAFCLAGCGPVKQSTTELPAEINILDAGIAPIGEKSDMTAERAAEEFTAAFLNGDRETMKRYAAPGCRCEVFDGTYSGEVSLKGLENAEYSDNCVITAEFTGNGESCFLIMQLSCGDNGWRISSYTIEK